MSETINILCATDDYFAPYCGIMLTSVFENNQKHKCCVYIFISQPLKKKNTKRFVKLGDKYGQTISFIQVDISSYNYDQLIHEGDHVSVATFYRLYAGELLPQSVNRVLYLDGDIIVTGDLSQLWGIDMTGRAVAAVDDAVLANKRPKELHYPEEAGYFNAGVLLMNLDYWREQGIGRQCFNYLERYTNTLRYHDQDVLNAVIWDYRIKLPLKYNYQLTLLNKIWFDCEQINVRKKELEETGLPLIIHFCTALKPWMIPYYREPFWETWASYKKISPWSHLLPYIPHRKPINWLIKYYFLWPLEIMRR